MQKDKDRKSSSSSSRTHGNVHGGDRSNSSAGRKSWSSSNKDRRS